MWSFVILITIIIIIIIIIIIVIIIIIIIIIIVIKPRFSRKASQTFNFMNIAIRCTY